MFLIARYCAYAVCAWKIHNYNSVLLANDRYISLCSWIWFWFKLSHSDLRNFCDALCKPKLIVIYTVNCRATLRYFIRHGWKRKITCLQMRIPRYSYNGLLCLMSFDVAFWWFYMLSKWNNFFLSDPET